SPAAALLNLKERKIEIAPDVPVRSLNSSWVKRLVGGGGSICGGDLYSSGIHTICQPNSFKSCNSLPMFDSVDKALLNRIIPFLTRYTFIPKHR
ncbi:LOW QUALITY PROTEIN: hypothetical protein HZS_6358, partial [Henneguya salminicola]